MRRILIGFVAALMLFTLDGAAPAEEGAGVQAGLKMWLNRWTHDDPGVENIRSDTAALLGPAVEVKFENQVFAEASFLFSVSDYTFSDGNTINDKREDLDLAIGYLIVPRFGMLAGYKNSSLRGRETGIEETIAGPFAGVVANLPVDQGVSFYSRLNYYFTRFKQTGPSAPGAVSKEDSPGWNFEFGIRFDYTRAFSGMIGYKYETNTGKSSNVEDTFSGLTLTGMLGF